MMRRLRMIAAIAAGCLTLGGCGFSAYDLPLPGGADTGSNPMTLHLQFRDVLDLVPDSTVKLNDVTVGKVDSIALKNGIADVTVKVRNDTKLPADTTADIEQTSLLGEKFVALQAPAGASSTQALKSGDTIPLARTGRNPEIEEVLGALSLILNGGGVAQLKTISTELDKALAGHEDAAKSVLTQVDLFAKNLDDNKQAITNALDAIARLSASARSQEHTIDDTLTQLPSALASIDQQRQALVTMLQALSKLGDTGVRVINASKQGTIDIVRDLQPVLTSLARSGDHFVNAFNTLLTYPFVDAAVGGTPQAARNLHMGDFVNLDITLNLDLSQVLNTNPGSLLPSVLNPTQVVGQVLQCIASGSLTSQACVNVLASATALTQLRTECLKTANSGTAVCQLINKLPGLPNLSGSLPSPIAGVLSGLGLRQAAPRAPVTLHTGPKGPTYGELAALYDPALVSLMVPGLTAGSSRTVKEASK